MQNENLYDCEIEGCINKTEGYLCEFHSKQAQDETNQVWVCETCNKIIKIVKRESPEIPRYYMVKDCMRCRQREVPSDPE